MQALVVLIGCAVALDMALDLRQGCAVREAGERIGKLEKRLRGEADPQNLAEGIEDLGLSMQDLEAEVDRLGGGSGAWRSGKGKGGGDQELDAQLSAMLPGIEEMIDRKVDEQLGSAGKTERKPAPSMDELASRIGMSDFQKSEAQKIIDGTKMQAMEVISTPRPDGSSLVTDLQAAMLQSPTPKQDAMKVLLKMMVEPVPGSDLTYYQSLKSLQAQSESEMGRILSEDQMGEWHDMDVNTFAVQTGYNPLMDYFRQVMATAS